MNTRAWGIDSTAGYHCLAMRSRSIGKQRRNLQGLFPMPGRNAVNEATKDYCFIDFGLRKLNQNHNTPRGYSVPERWDLGFTQHTTK